MHAVLDWLLGECITDDSHIYGNLPFVHDSVNHSAGEYVRGNVHSNGMESVWAVFKRSLHDT